MDKKPLKKQLSTIFRWVGWVVLVQLVLINVSASLYAYKLTHFYAEASSSTGNENIFSKSWKLFTGPRYPRPEIGSGPVFPYDTIQFTTKKGLTIDAWYAKADSNARGTVILFHGVTVTRSTLLDEANEFRFQGYSVLLVDFRGHGNSDGNTTTLGVRETEEVKLAYDHVKKMGENNIFLFGSSMGAVAVAKSIHDYKLEPSGVILEMPFLSLQTYLKARARMIGFPSQPFAFFTTFWIGIERGFNGYGHKTTRYVKDISVPVLLQWGTLDNYVLRPDIEKIYAAITTPNKKLAIYEGAQHESLLRREPIKWRAELESFLTTSTRK
jgi:alpha-beta hydrolase superfamily lysophospholipase